MLHSEAQAEHVQVYQCQHGPGMKAGELQLQGCLHGELLEYAPGLLDTLVPQDFGIMMITFMMIICL